MASRLIRLRYATTCAQCGRALAPNTNAWWDAGAKAASCERCRPQAPADARVGVAGGSAMRTAASKRARREAHVRAAHPHIGGFLLAVTDEPQDIKNWEKGGVGEQKLGAGLDGLAAKGVLTLHDRLRPGGGQANIDHVAIGPSGVWVIDAKRYTGQVRTKDVGGWLRRDVRLFVGRRDCTKLLEGVQKQVDAVRRTLGDEWADVPVRSMLCFVDTDWQWFAKPFELAGVLVTWPRAARERVSGPGPICKTDIDVIAGRLDARLRPAS